MVPRGTAYLHLQGAELAARDDYMGSSPTFRQEDTNRRSAQLQPFIQQQCSGAVQSLAQELSAQLKHLGQPGMDLEGARLVEQALLLGLSHCLPDVMSYHASSCVMVIIPCVFWDRRCC